MRSALPALLLSLAAAVPLSVSAQPAAPTPSPEAMPAGWCASLDSFASARFRHPAWGFAHSRRDYALAKAMAAEDKVPLDDDVLYAAAMLHDIAAFPPWFDASGDHADQAVAILPDKLRAAGFPVAKIPAVLDAVRTHMFDRAPATSEARYLHDADALDWLGAVGIYRLVAIVESDGRQPDAATALGMLRQRLEAVPAGVVTPAGRKRLPARVATVRAFLAELSDESEGLNAL